MISPTRLIATYTAVLCSPGFVCLDEKPGRLDDYALASRLSFFLWNSAPDEELRQLAASGQLHQPAILTPRPSACSNRPEVAPVRRCLPRLLARPAQDRRHRPDATLYPTTISTICWSSPPLAETQLFFAELLQAVTCRPAIIVSSDFAMLNERLAAHYGIPGVEGVALRRCSCRRTACAAG